MIRILSIVPYKIFPAKVGGQKGIALFNEWLAKEAALVCVTVKSNDPAYAKGYALLNILSDASYRYINPFYIFTISRLIKKYSCTHLILEHPYYGWLGIILKSLTGVKLVIHSHNIENTRWKSLGKWWWKILYWYERFTHKQADYNFFIHDDDRHFAVRDFGLKPSSCTTVTYGIDWNIIPAKADTALAKTTVMERHNISDHEKILLFNGAFDYRPNLQALKIIVEMINPLLKSKSAFPYKILICGRDIPADLIQVASSDIIFAGFVEDVSLYFKASDIFINPVMEGGGIKTKLVEALGYNLNAVSTLNGAIGVDASLCNGKLLITADNNWIAFAEAIEKLATLHADIPAAYFQKFYWGYSVKNAVALMSS